MTVKADIPMVELINRILSDMTVAAYSAATINAYRKTLQTIRAFFKKHNQQMYEQNLLEMYMAGVLERYKENNLSWSHMRLIRKAAHILSELAVQGEFSFDRYRHPVPNVTDYYESILSLFRDYLDVTSNCTSKVKRRKENDCRKFFRYLNDLKLHNLSAATLKIADDYVSEKASRLGTSAICNIQHSLKELCKCLEMNSTPFFDFSPALYMRPSKRTKVMPAFSEDNVIAISSAIDNRLANAKRDTAMFSIAGALGIRGGDIAALKLRDIHWEKNEVLFVQGKTNVEVVLPLSAELGNVIADYILNERPHSASEYIFLRSLAPYEVIDAETVTARLLKYMDLSGVSHKPGLGLGVHSYRRYVASQMLDNGVDAETVSQVLGHTSFHSLKPYIRVSKERLRNCALGFKGIEPLEGLCRELYF